MTAEEFLKEYFEGLQPLTREESYVKNESRNLVIELLADFARLKGKEILEAAVYNAGVKTIKIPINGEEGTFEIDVVDEDTILNAYDLNSIK